MYRTFGIIHRLLCHDVYTRYKLKKMVWFWRIWYNDNDDDDDCDNDYDKVNRVTK